MESDICSIFMAVEHADNGFISTKVRNIYHKTGLGNMILRIRIIIFLFPWTSPATLSLMHKKRGHELVKEHILLLI